MKKAFAFLLCLLIPLVVSANGNSYKIEYDGGSLATLKTGAALKIRLDGEVIRILKGDQEVAAIPSAAVTEISYGQDVHRRVGAAVGVAVFTLGVGALLALSKSKKHFIGLTWDDAGKRGGVAFQADKSDYRGLLLGLEGITGKTSVDSASLNVKN